jgi:prepilin-type N-terminal cleavage/methylation domain-containing protein
MRRAFTLPELMLTLAVVGLLLAITLPQLGRAMNRIQVEGATAELVAAHRRARMMAVTRGQVLTLSVDSAAFSIASTSSPTPLWSAAGPLAAGVSLSGPTRQFKFSPEGFTLGLSNASLLLSRGGISRTIVISRLGRIRVLR